MGDSSEVGIRVSGYGSLERNECEKAKECEGVKKRTRAQRRGRKGKYARAFVALGLQRYPENGKDHEGG